MSDKPKRGRPRGTGKKDEPHLLAVARILIEDVKMKPTTAMHRVMRQEKWTESDTTLIRRWQVKWKEGGERFLAAARQESADRSAAQARRSKHEARGVGGIAEYVRAAMPVGFEFPKGIVHDLAFAKIPTDLDLRHLSELASVHKSAMDVAKAMAPYEAVFKQQKQMMELFKHHDMMSKVYAEMKRVREMQHLFKLK